MKCIIKHYGTSPYQTTWEAMSAFTNNRTKDTLDEFWIVEHPSVYTQGQAGKAEHILQETQIPIVQTDRGGQITYHGPGQLIIYTLIDIKRHAMSIRQLVSLLENSVIDLLNDYAITASANPKAPGVYVDGAKICALGLRVRKGCAFHGLALNVAMDLSPFEAINPCGYPGMRVTQMSNFDPKIDINQISAQLMRHLMRHLGYNASN